MTEPVLAAMVSDLAKTLTVTIELLEKGDAQALSGWLDDVTADISTLPMTKLLRFGVSQTLSPDTSPVMKANRGLSVALSPHRSALVRLDGLLGASFDANLPSDHNAKLLQELKVVLDSLGQSEDVRKALVPLLRSKNEQLIAASSSPIFKLVNEQVNAEVISSVSTLMHSGRFHEALQEVMNRVVLPLVPAVTQLDTSALADVKSGDESTSGHEGEANKRKTKNKKKGKKSSSLDVSGMKLTTLELPSKISTSVLMCADNLLVPGSEVYEAKNLSTSMVVVTSGLSMKIDDTHFSYERRSFPRFKRSGHVAIDIENVSMRFGLKASAMDTSGPSVSISPPKSQSQTQPPQQEQQQQQQPEGEESLDMTPTPIAPNGASVMPMVLFECDASTQDGCAKVQDLHITMAKDVANHKLLNGVIVALHGVICAKVNQVLEKHMSESMDHLATLLNVAMMVQQQQQH